MKKPAEKMSRLIGTLSGLVTMAWKLGSVMAQPAAKRTILRTAHATCGWTKYLRKTSSSVKAATDSVVYSTGFIRESIFSRIGLGRMTLPWRK